MKYYTTLIIVLLIIISSCGDNKKTENKITNKQETTSSKSDNNYRIGMDYFNEGDWGMAKSYFIQVDLNNKNYDDAMQRLKICSEKQNEQITSTKEINSEKSITKNSLPKIGEKVVINGRSLMVKSISDCLEPKLGKPKPGNKYIDVEVIMENVGSERMNYNCLYFDIEDDEGYIHDYAFTSCGDPGFSAGDLQPGQKRRGFMSFELPKKSKASKLIYDGKITIDLKK